MITITDYPGFDALSYITGLLDEAIHRVSVDRVGVGQEVTPFRFILPYEIRSRRLSELIYRLVRDTELPDNAQVHRIRVTDARDYIGAQIDGIIAPGGWDPEVDGMPEMPEAIHISDYLE